MIKIEIPHKQQKKKEFLIAIKPLIKERIELLFVSTKHLRGDTIDKSEGNINKYKFLTCKIINELAFGNMISHTEFAQKKYQATVTNCLNKHKTGSKLDDVNFDGILELLDELLNDNGKVLEGLLVCEADRLLTESEYLLTKFKLNTDSDIFLLKQAFDYESGDISDGLKIFFRTNNFVNFCPYCNITEVKFVATKFGRVATSHDLDHFFDKARHPLLACSFFNLVPCDNICNGQTNKGSFLFTDEFHLNPYRSGFGKNLVFIPVMQGKSVKEIDIDIKANKGSEIRKQMLGSLEEINEDDRGKNEHKEGNVNVFTLLSKYKERGDLAENVLKGVSKADNGMRALRKFMNLMINLDMDKAYKTWYELTFNTSFDTTNFNNKAYSKFNRDIHDYYYLKDLKLRNNFIRKMI